WGTFQSHCVATACDVKQAKESQANDQPRMSSHLKSDARVSMRAAGLTCKLSGAPPGKSPCRSLSSARPLERRVGRRSPSHVQGAKSAKTVIRACRIVQRSRYFTRSPHQRAAVLSAES